MVGQEPIRLRRSVDDRQAVVGMVIVPELPPLRHRRQGGREFASPTTGPVEWCAGQRKRYVPSKKFFWPNMRTAGLVSANVTRPLSVADS